jgi:hypothetical protein
LNNGVSMTVLFEEKRRSTMERKLLVAIALLGMCLLAPNGVLAQGADNFDSYTAGAVIPPGHGWVGWGGDTANGIVTEGPANSLPNSLAVVGGAGTDQVLEFGYDPKTGQWTFSAMTYIPSEGRAGEQYFNLMNRFDVDATGAGTTHWSNVEVHFRLDPAHADADTVTRARDSATAQPIQYDTWVEVRADIDLDANSCEIFYDGVSLGGPTTWQKGAQPIHGIDCLDIFPISEDASVMYYDDISLTPEPATMALLGIGGLALIRRRRRA